MHHRTLACLALLTSVTPAAAQDVLSLRAGAHAVPLVTRVSPMLQGEPMTEAYLTQPTLLAGASLFGSAVEARVTISLEALTLERGELGAGAYGEGYVDRRHPHTYLHEAVLTATRDAAFAAASLTLGRGFAPFGTDDPMSRPFAKFPVNHHLGQVLERWIGVAAVHAGPVIVEGGVFNGNEPLDPTDLGRLSRFGDSWSARLTLLPLAGVELQASHARLESPELPSGGGLDQRKLSASVRYTRAHAAGAVYALLEWKRTAELDRGLEVLEVGSVLGEARVTVAGWSPALRVEVSERPEEGRISAFRAPWPHADTHLLGITRWTIVAGRVEKALNIGALGAAPFVEVSYSRVAEAEPGLFEPAAFYGDTRIWTLNLGARLRAGWHPARMGRYGVAAAPAAGAAHTH